MISFAKKVMFISGGSLLSQLINFAGTLLLARLYLPSDFGILGTYSALYVFLSLALSFRYEQAILVATDFEKNSIFNLCLKIIFINIIVITLLISVFEFFFDMPLVYLILPLSIFFNACLNVFQIMEIKNNAEKKVGLMIVVRSILTLFAQVVMYFIMPNYYGLILGILLSMIITTYSFRDLFKDINIDLGISKNEKKYLCKYKNYLFYNTPYALLSSLSMSGSIMIFGYFYSAKMVGLLYMAEKLLKAPIAAFSMALKSIFIKNFSKMKASERIDFYKKMNWIMFGASIFFVLIFVCLPKDIYTYILGEKWKNIGSIIFYILPYICSLIFSTIATATIVAIDEMSYLLWINLVDVLLKLFLALIIWIENLVFTDAVVLYAFLSALNGVLVVLYCNHLMKFCIDDEALQ